MDWVAIISAVVVAIQKCQETNESKLVKTMRKPAASQRLGFEGNVRRAMGMGFIEWRREGREIMATIDEELKNTSDDELKDLIKQARAKAA